MFYVNFLSEQRHLNLLQTARARRRQSSTHKNPAQALKGLARHPQCQNCYKGPTQCPQCLKNRHQMTISQLILEPKQDVLIVRSKEVKTVIPLEVWQQILERFQCTNVHLQKCGLSLNIAVKLLESLLKVIV